jgi:hypothetical protein
MNRRAVQTDEDLLAIDIVSALAGGRYSGEIAVAAAVRADRLGVQPRSLTFLAEIVRRGGIPYAARLPEPLPTADQSALIVPWLDASAGPADALARWLDAVAVALDGRRSVRLTGP